MLRGVKNPWTPRPEASPASHQPKETMVITPPRMPEGQASATHTVPAMTY